MRRCFDSILVRLKGDGIPRPVLSPVTGFDSILVRLKVQNVIMEDGGKDRFDSILVRLKGPPRNDRCDEILSAVSIPYWFD